MNRNKMFLTGTVTVILFLVLGIFVRGQKEISITENRKLDQFPKFSLEDFKDSTFQDNIENALTDQLLFSEEFKSLYNSLKNKNTQLVTNILKSLNNKGDIEVIETPILDEEDVEVDPFKPLDFQIGLTPFGGNLAKIDDSDHLVFPKRTLDMANDLFESKTNSYNEIVKKHPELSYNSYYIETDVDIDFINGSISHDLVQDFQSRLDDSIKTDGLYIKTPKDYQKFFYKTDHHWGSKGQLEGYKGIIKLLKGEDEELLDIKEVLIEGLKYNGYKSRQIDNYDIYDDFNVLWADLPNHQVKINNNPAPYGSKMSYIDGKWSSEVGVNHYGIANGGDHGLIEYNFSQPDEKNILIFVDSFSNPINSLIASHFNNTYIVDLRYYADAFDKDFSFSEFLKEYDIDEVLWTGYYFFYANDIFLIND